MLAIILILTCLFVAIAYRWYGAFLERKMEIDPLRETPAVQRNDGVDFVPSSPAVVFGHHFSSIAGAGPIVGPIVAAAAFGWGPTWLWVLLGAIFIGGVHDFGSTVVSLRYGGRSITEALRDLVGEKTGKLFLLFVLFTLIYVIVVFLDLTAASFVSTPPVATASGWFILVAFAFGVVTKSGRLAARWSIPIFIVLTYAGLALGHWFPAPALTKEAWIGVVLAYCFFAAILPVQTLMQPRDFLSATFLYAIMILGVAGALLRREDFTMPMFTGFESENLGMLVPFLFITVACGACSGFHSMVASGTTSKQLANERDVRKVAYGGMLVEAVLATFAIGCVAVVGGLKGSAVGTFAEGAAIFFSALGIPPKLGVEFATLAVGTFLLTTLDTCVRLSRFLVEELFQWKGNASRWLTSLGVVILAGWAALQKFAGPNGEPMAAWQALWPLFGATNQLLAAMALVILAVFLRSRRIRLLFVAIPAAVMVVMPLLALGLMAWDERLSSLLRGSAAVQIVLGGFVLAMCLRFLWRPAREKTPVKRAIGGE